MTSTAAEKIIASMKDLQFMPAKPVQGLPRIIGKYPDNLTAIEIIGTVQDPQRITILGALSPDATDAARRTGMLMAHMLDLIAPLWKYRHRWLTMSLKLSETRQDTYEYKLDYAIVSLRYNKRSGIVAMNIRLKGIT